MLFPRFQQLDAVRKLMADARENGCGQSYLIQHSAGSGKSNTIGWAAHHAIKLHTKDNQFVVDTGRGLQKMIPDVSLRSKTKSCPMRT